MNDNHIELISEKGKEIFEILLRFRFKGSDYIALSPLAMEQEDVAVFEIHKKDLGEEEYIAIEDNNLAKEVFVHFISLWEITQDEDE